MLTRRALFRAARAAGWAAFASLRPDGILLAREASANAAGRPPDELASDENFWHQIQQAFTLDRTIINLNNGGVSPSPRGVHEAYKRYLDVSNQSPVYHMWQILEPNIESVRRELAAEFGCSAEELAITRSASEALQIAQLGLDLAPGDEVVTTNQDYPRMLDTWEQRVRRDRITLTRISFPVPPRSLGELTARFDNAISSKTKVLHLSHMTYLTGQILPVKDICRIARARGIKTIVDGAHAFAQLPFKVQDLECDYYGTSLHKWLFAPVGTGFLYMRREHIASHWPLTPAPSSKSQDIRKFEEIGTHPAAGHNAIAEALQFHRAIGIERKAARLRYLRERWARRLEGQDGVRILTSFDPTQSGGLGTVAFYKGDKAIDSGGIASHLWDRHRILVAAITHNEYQGIRVTPSVYTTIDEVDTFASAMDDIVRDGMELPSSGSRS